MRCSAVSSSPGDLGISPLEITIRVTANAKAASTKVSRRETDSPRMRKPSRTGSSERSLAKRAEW